MNKVILIGNLTRDPELSTTNSGVSVCRFSIAVTRKFENSAGEKETDFFNIIAWRGLGETYGKFLKKGSKCGIVGSLQNRSYTDKDGGKHSVTEIIAEDVEFLSSAQTKSTTAQPDLTPVADDDLPF